MPTSEETFVNRFVVQPISMMRWKTYRLLVTRADLQDLLQELSGALAKTAHEVQEDENGTPYSPIWKAYATEAYVRTDRTQFEIAVAEDLAPYHERSRKTRLKDRASVVLLVGLGVVFVVGALTIGYFALKGIDWLLFSHHRV